MDVKEVLWGIHAVDYVGSLIFCKILLILIVIFTIYSKVIFGYRTTA
jgi:hypothetical protein